MNLYQISRAILSLSPTPISKIRFTRVVYFVHKELVRKGFMQLDDISYLRSPLGPVPDGLPQLAHNYAEIMLQKSSTEQLSYADEEFFCSLTILVKTKPPFLSNTATFSKLSTKLCMLWRCAALRSSLRLAMTPVGKQTVMALSIQSQKPISKTPFLLLKLLKSVFIPKLIPTKLGKFKLIFSKAC